MMVASSYVLLCLRIYSGKLIKYSKFVEHDCALQYLKPAVVVLSF